MEGGLSTEDRGQLQTERLILRRWAESDREAFVRLFIEALDGGPPGAPAAAPLTAARAGAHLDTILLHYEQEGFGPMAVIERASGAVVGHAGVTMARFAAHFCPAVEIGWRVAAATRGKGYASEAAKAAAAHAFETIGCREIVAFTPVWHEASRRVMQRIGMTHDPADDFDHPAFDADDPRRRQVLYRLGSV